VEVQRATNVRGPYSETRTILPVTDGKYRGPGHVGVLKQDGCNFVSTHYYDLSDNGNAKLDIQRMTYSGGWPVLTRNFSDFGGCGGISDGLYAFRSRLSGKLMSVANASTADGALVQQLTDSGIAQWGYWAGQGQQWRFASPAAGYYTVANRLSGMVLDVKAKSTADYAQIIQYTLNNAANQQWSLERK
jgi:arabinan endo-1,5-alpha-L-arabinosidase